MTERDAEIGQVLIAQIGQDVPLDCVFGEELGVLIQPEFRQPGLDVVHYPVMKS